MMFQMLYIMATTYDDPDGIHCKGNMMFQMLYIVAATYDIPDIIHHSNNI